MGLKGAVPFKVESGEFALRFTTNALCDIEDRTGQPITEVFGEVTGGSAKVPFKLVRMLFAAGMRGAGHDIDDEGAGALIDELGMVTAGEMMGQAMMAAFPDAKPGKATAAA